MQEHIRAPRPGETPQQTRERGSREFMALQQTPKSRTAPLTAWASKTRLLNLVMSAVMAGSGEGQRLLAARHPIVKRDERAGAVHETPRAHGFDIAAGRVARRGLVVGVAPGREALP